MRGPLDLFVELGGGGGGRDADRTDPAVVQSRQRLYLHKSAFCCLDSLGNYLGSASTRVATGEVLFFLIPWYYVLGCKWAYGPHSVNRIWVFI